MNNRIKKYTLYAIGEIILVVIGILIALQINNWNERQKVLAKEQQILNQLQSEYQSNLRQLDEKILMRNEGLESAYFLLEKIDNPEGVSETELYSAFQNIIRDPTFDPIKNDIVETENLRILRNDSLVRALSNWTSDVEQVQELEIQYQKYRTEYIVACYNRLGIMRNIHNNVWKDGYTPTEALDKTNKVKLSIGQSARPIAVDAILDDLELEGLLAHAITFHQITNIQSQALRNKILNILELIDSEIDG